MMKEQEVIKIENKGTENKKSSQEKQIQKMKIKFRASRKQTRN